MRARILLLFFSLLALDATAQKNAPANAIRSASFAYSSQITTAILQAVVPELAKNFRQLRGSLKFSFHLDRGGHVSVVKVVSSTSNRFVEQTTVRAIRAFRFPPIPKKVIAEQGRDWVDIDSEMTLDRH
jgi:TonB family protein